MIGYSFTPRLRNVFAMAREEAHRLAHEYIGTEHLLLALLREDDGGSAAVLRHLDIAPDRIRQQVEEIVVPGRGLAIGPDLPYTARAKKALELMLNEVMRVRGTAADTEHLLVGLCAEDKGIAAQVLASTGLTTDVARATATQLFGTNAEPPLEATGVAEIVAVRIEIRRMDGTMRREDFPNVEAALEFLRRQGESRGP